MFICSHSSNSQRKDAQIKYHSIEHFLDKELITVTPLSLVGHVQDPYSPRWLEARSAYEYIPKGIKVTVIGIEKNRDCLIVVPKPRVYSMGKSSKI